MASKSEVTFGNRLQKGRDMLVSIQAMEDYKPSNPEILPQNFSDLLDSTESKNSEVAEKNQILTDKRTVRLEGYSGTDNLNDRCSQIRDYVASLRNGKSSTHYKQIQKQVQKIRNYKKSRKQKPVEDVPTQAQKKSVSTSEQGFGSVL